MRTRPGTTTPAACEALVERSRQESVAALVHAQGATRALRSSFATVCANIVRECVAVELLEHAELIRMLHALDAAGIRVLLLNGALLAYSAYPAAHLRPRVDVDLLLADVASLDRCTEALAGLGYAPLEVPAATLISSERGLYHSTGTGYIHALDSHWQLSNQAIFAGALQWDELHAAAVAVPALDPCARELGRVHALMHACMHRISHLPWDENGFGPGDRLIWIYDFDLLARRFTPTDFDELLRLASARRAAGTCWDGLREAVTPFATPLPDGLLAALEADARLEAFDVRRARQSWYQECHNLRAMPGRQRVAWVREKLFPSRAYMREAFDVDGSGGLLQAHVQRLCHGVRMTLSGRRR